MKKFYRLYECYQYGERYETRRGLTKEQIDEIIQSAKEDETYGILWWYEVG